MKAECPLRSPFDRGNSGETGIDGERLMNGCRKERISVLLAPCEWSHPTGNDYIRLIVERLSMGGQTWVRIIDHSSFPINR